MTIGRTDRFQPTPWARSVRLPEKKAASPGFGPAEDRYESPPSGTLHRRLAKLARTLGKDFRLKLVPGPTWAYHFDENQITYPAAELQTRGELSNMGVICHELAHRLYSRIPPDDRIANPAFHFLWNAVEDVRINRIICARYAGVPKMMRALYDDFTDIEARRQQQRELNQSKESIPLARQFGLAVIYAWASGGQRDPLITDPEVHAALELAGAALEEATRLPPGLDLRFGDLDGDEAGAEAARSFRIIRDEIWPIYVRLVERDLDARRLPTLRGKQGADEPRTSEENRAPASPAGSKSIDVNSIPKNPLEQAAGDDAASRAAKERLGRDLAAGARDLCAKIPNAELAYGGDESVDFDALMKTYQQRLEKRSGRPPLGPWSAMKKKHQNVIRELVEELRRVFDEDSLPRLVGHFQGGVYDLRRAMQADFARRATGRADPRVFLRRAHPEKKSVALVLCIDCSGSMGRGERSKMAYAKEAFVVFAEALSEIGIEHGALMYDSEASILKPIEQDADDRAREAMLDRLQAGGGNNDTAALDAAQRMLAGSGADQKIVIFLSDGAAVANQKERVESACAAGDIKVIGIGIGDGCERVRTTYRHHLAVSNTETLPRELGRLLLEEVAGR